MPDIVSVASPGAPTATAAAAAAASVSVVSDRTQTTTMKVSSWGMKFTPATQCGPEALRRWTESPPPVSTSPISPGGEPNKMVYVSKWLHDQTSDDVSPPPVPVTPPPPPQTAYPHKVNIPAAAKTQCTSRRILHLPSTPAVAATQLYSEPTNDHLYQMFVP